MPKTVDQMKTTELSAGRLATASASYHTSPLGLIPKTHQLDRIRLIAGLSVLQGSSTNDGIDFRLCSLEYATIDQAARLAREVVPGALMYKLDLSNTYRRVLIHLDDNWTGLNPATRTLTFRNGAS